MAAYIVVGICSFQISISLTRNNEGSKLCRSGHESLLSSPLLAGPSWASHRTLLSGAIKMRAQSFPWKDRSEMFCSCCIKKKKKCTSLKPLIIPLALPHGSRTDWYREKEQFHQYQQSICCLWKQNSNNPSAYLI